MARDPAQRIEELFHAAIERSASERSAYLAQVCADDPGLIEVIESLLRLHQSDPSFLERPARVGARPNDLRVGQGIGAYVIEREIAEGGMGRVFLARRRDGQFEMRVAIKTVKPAAAAIGSATGRDVVRRFLNERQHLADLEHPHIAKLLDGGETEDGSPYLVMEYIDGEPIDSFCASRGLSLEERLRLFRDVCRAVQYAHSKFIAHCDLKPSNILVRPGPPPRLEPTPKLLDFGIAKFLEAELPARLEATETLDALRLTPVYASPEQLRGERPSTATDIYSLGVILYELVTGALPYPVRETPLHDLPRIVCEASPKRPSLIQPKLRGDLETILLKALEKDPTRRYQTAAAFADDIERFLTKQPISAHPPSAAYRLAKVVSRHRLASAAVAAYVLTATALGIWMSVLYARAVRAEKTSGERLVQAESALRIADEERVAAKRAQAVAERRRSEVEKTANVFGEIFASPNPYRAKGREVTVAEALDDAVPRIVASLESEPVLQAAVQSMAGQTYASLGELDKAESILRAALEIRRRLLGVESQEACQSAAYLANVLVDRGRPVEAEVLLREALETSRRVRGEEDPDTIAFTINLANALFHEGRLDEAVSLVRRAVETSLRVFGLESEETLKSQENLAVYLIGRSELGEAESLLRRCAEVRARARGEDDLDLARVRVSLLSVLSRQGKFVEVEPIARQTLGQFRRRLGDEHKDTLVTMNNLAATLRRLGKLAEAEDLLREVWETQKRVLGAGHTDTLASQQNLAAVLGSEGKPDEAEVLLSDALSTAEGALPEGHWYVPWIRSNYGQFLVVSKRFEEAEAQLERSYGEFMTALGARNEYTANAVRGLAMLYEAWGKPEQAARYRALLLKPAEGSSGK